MNLSIDPGEDFFSYANYHWIADHPVPEDKKFYTAFEEVKDMVDSRVRTLVEEAASDYDAEKGTPRQLLGSFYRAALNDDSNARTGITRSRMNLTKLHRHRIGVRFALSHQILLHGDLTPFLSCILMKTRRRERSLSRP
jgi:putative endopeptidase